MSGVGSNDYVDNITQSLSSTNVLTTTLEYSGTNSRSNISNTVDLSSLAAGDSTDTNDYIDAISLTLSDTNELTATLEYGGTNGLSNITGSIDLSSLAGSGSGASDFLALTDTPDSYTQIVTVPGTAYGTSTQRVTALAADLWRESINDDGSAPYSYATSGENALTTVDDWQDSAGWYSTSGIIIPSQLNGNGRVSRVAYQSNVMFIFMTGSPEVDRSVYSGLSGTVEFAFGDSSISTHEPTSIRMVDSLDSLGFWYFDIRFGANIFRGYESEELIDSRFTNDGSTASFGGSGNSGTTKVRVAADLSVIYGSFTVTIEFRQRSTTRTEGHAGKLVAVNDQSDGLAFIDAPSGITAEFIQDTVASFLRAGSNISLAYSDFTNALTITGAGTSSGGGGSNDGVVNSVNLSLSGTNLSLSVGRTVGGNLSDTVSLAGLSTGGGGPTQEQVEDWVAAMFTGGSHSNISFTYDDTNGQIDATATGGGGGGGASVTVGTGLDVSNNNITLDLSELSRDISPTTSDYVIIDSDEKVLISDLLGLAGSTSGGVDEFLELTDTPNSWPTLITEILDGRYVFTLQTKTGNHPEASIFGGNGTWWRWSAGFQATLPSTYGGARISTIVNKPGTSFDIYFPWTQATLPGLPSTTREARITIGTNAYTSTPFHQGTRDANTRSLNLGDSVQTADLESVPVGGTIGVTLSHTITTDDQIKLPAFSPGESTTSLVWIDVPSGVSLSNATPLPTRITGSPGTSTFASRADHVHQSTTSGGGGGGSGWDAWSDVPRPPGHLTTPASDDKIPIWDEDNDEWEYVNWSDFPSGGTSGSNDGVVDDVSLAFSSGTLSITVGRSGTLSNLTDSVDIPTGSGGGASVTVGTGLDISSNNITLDFSELSEDTSIASTDYFITGGTQRASIQRILALVPAGNFDPPVGRLAVDNTDTFVMEIDGSYINNNAQSVIDSILHLRSGTVGQVLTRTATGFEWGDL